jgi:hypothetical protein
MELKRSIGIPSWKRRFIHLAANQRKKIIELNALIAHDHFPFI